MLGTRRKCSVVSDSLQPHGPGSSVHGLLQARILEWVAIPFSRGSSQCLLHYRQILFHLSYQGCRDLDESDKSLLDSALAERRKVSGALGGKTNKGRG